VIHGPPEIVALAVDLHEHLIEMPAPLVAIPHRLHPPATNFSRENRAKSVPPKPHRLTADVDATLVQQILNVAQRQREPDVHHHRRRMISGDVLH
jgi:hypothetical protein